MSVGTSRLTCGPIGTLSILAARAAGAAEIVVTDLVDSALSFAKTVGADKTINVATQSEALTAYQEGKGYFDVMYECSGNEQALRGAISALKPCSTLMQLGLGGDMTLPMMQLTAKEIDLCGSFRFHSEFRTAVELMLSGLVDVKPLITHTMDLAEALKAFEVANDRSTAMKAQINFN